MKCGGVGLLCPLFLPGKAKMNQSTSWSRSGKSVILIQKPLPATGCFGSKVQPLILFAARYRCVLWMIVRSAPLPRNALRVDLHQAASSGQDGLVADLG